MARRNVIKFLKTVANSSSLQEELRVKSKDEVMNNAKNLGYDFVDNEFDDLVWELEIFLAEKRSEKFDQTFSLWTTMWGKYYLQYVLDNVIGSLSDQDIEQVLGKSESIPVTV
ncbi:Nif11-like leader peptide family natural product precursor [Nostoc sp. CHAB 5824]|nr:Nif11-like leader peptide family natural product precursor [Nostoc sp. CHAB 5824]